MTKNWREMQRTFRHLDTTNSGVISVSNFRKVLEHCGIKLDSDDIYHILEALDPSLSGTVNYRTFLIVIFD